MASGKQKIFTGSEQLMTTTTQVKSCQHFEMIEISKQTNKSIAELHREALDLLIKKYTNSAKG